MKISFFFPPVDDDEDSIPQDASETEEPASSSWLRCVLQWARGGVNEKRESEGKEIEGGLKRTNWKGRESKGKVKGRRWSARNHVKGLKWNRLTDWQKGRNRRRRETTDCFLCKRWSNKTFHVMSVYVWEYLSLLALLSINIYSVVHHVGLPSNTTLMYIDFPAAASFQLSFLNSFYLLQLVFGILISRFFYSIWLFSPSKFIYFLLAAYLIWTS